MKKRGGFVFIILILIIIGIAAALLWHQRIKTTGERGFYGAKKLYEEKKYDESYRAFASLLKRYRTAFWRGEAIYYAAKNLSLMDRFEEAKNYWEKLRDRYGENMYGDEINFYMGRGYEAEGNLKEAVSYYQKVIKDFSASSLVDEALCGVGRIYEKEGMLEGAVTSFEKVAANYPESKKVAEALLSIATLYEKKEDWEKSLKLYYKVIKDFPEGREMAQKAEDGIGRINVRLIFSQYPSEDSFIYKVEQGDSLNSIAKKFNTTVELIMDANGLNSNMIKPGQRFKILRSNFSIRVSKRDNRLYIENNGKLIKVYKVATGKDNSTPEGKFVIVNKLKDPTWYSAGAIIPPESPENILGSRWLGFSEQGYGLHGTNNPKDLGGYVTNGCVRLLEDDIQEIYKLVPVGTPLEIYGK